MTTVYASLRGGGFHNWATFTCTLIGDSIFAKFCTFYYFNLQQCHCTGVDLISVAFVGCTTEGHHLHI